MTVGVHEASVANGRLMPSASKKRFLGRAASSTLIRFVAALTVAAAVGIGTEARAATYWSDTDYGYAQPAPSVPQRAPKARRHAGKKTEPQVGVKEAAKPQGPLIIAISINKQNLKVYDDNGFYAETPVSTGMRGHSTPMGAFSVIQKQKMHRSNIYSGAPMPFMQRITWSGIAMHAGVLPGYPASHGCIRMPMAFAVKMYGWTRMGARVVVTPGELVPESFSHPLLATQKVVPQPVAADAPKADVVTVAKADRVVGADAAPKTPAANAPVSDANLELRSTVGHVDQLNTVADATPLREQTHTADAGASSIIKSPVTMSDAAPSSSEATDTPKGDDDAKQQAEAAAPASSETKPGETAAADAKVETAAEPKPADAPKADAAKVDDKANDNASAKPAEDVKADAAAVTAPDLNKDQARPADAEKAAAPKPNPAIVAASKRSGPISVFISRKDSKLYVRQNFAPLFEVPVTIAPSDRPLGTHIFTAEVDKNDANVIHWSVVSLPSPSRYAERRDEDERVSRKRKMAGAAEIKPMPEPDSPAEALDRLNIPADVMAAITEDLTTGGSIIVSDQGIAAGETGEGTDFIVSLR